MRKAGLELVDRATLLFAKTSHLTHLFKIFWKETIPPTVGTGLLISATAAIPPPLPLLTLVVSFLSLAASSAVAFMLYRFAKEIRLARTNRRKTVRASPSKPSRLRQQRKATTPRKKRSPPPVKAED